MSIKYCFNQEIHKSFNLPCDFSTLINDIKYLFVQKLPSNYLLQYEDADGDKIAITNDQEYRILVKQELPTVLSSVKIFITPLSPHHISDRKSTCTLKTNSEGSFEVIENESSLQLEEIEHEDQIDGDSKVVVSLQIPLNNYSKQEKKTQMNIQEKKEASFFSSASSKSGVNDSRDLVDEMSLSMVEDQSYREDDSYTLKDSHNQALQIQKETSGSAGGIAEVKIQEDIEGKKISLSEKMPNLKVKDTSSLSKYLDKISIKDSKQSLTVLQPVLCNNAPKNQISEENYREDSPERWASFSSHTEDKQFSKCMDFERGDLFILKQKPENWFLCNQDRSYRYKESEEEELNCNQQSMSDSSEKSGSDADSPRDEKEEEKNRRSHGLEVREVLSKQGSFEISFKENNDDLLQDIWFDLQGQVKSQTDTLRNNSCQDFDFKKDALADEESMRETMNISLLTASEAKRIASAIGSISRIQGVKKLKIFPESTTPTNEALTTKAKAASPVGGKWACRKSDIKLPGEEDWPFLKQSETPQNNKKEIPNIVENKVHEGSFCMGCWTSPIKGVRYMCLICDDIEYCENCEVKINHCHPLLKIKEPIGTLEDFMENLRSKFIQKSENVFPKGELSFKEDSIYKDIDTLGRSLERSLNFDNYQSPEVMREAYKFEYKEISSTPLMIKSNKKEWCVVYKTICLRNTGNTQWKKCHFEPVGIVPGTITEVSHVSPGDSALLTLEIHGFFAPGKYNSQWRVVHQGEMDELCEMGYLNLEFEVLENKGNRFGRQEIYENDEELFYGRKLEPMDFY